MPDVAFINWLTDTFGARDDSSWEGTRYLVAHDAVSGGYTVVDKVTGVPAGTARSPGGLLRLTRPLGIGLDDLGTVFP
jgi:hypothetical protein